MRMIRVKMRWVTMNSSRRSERARVKRAKVARRMVRKRKMRLISIAWLRDKEWHILRKSRVLSNNSLKSCWEVVRLGWQQALPQSLWVKKNMYSMSYQILSRASTNANQGLLRLKGPLWMMILMRTTMTIINVNQEQLPSKRLLIWRKGNN